MIKILIIAWETTRENMKKICIVFLALVSLFFGYGLIGAENIAARDHLTTTSRNGWIEEDLGPQVTMINVMGGDFGRDNKGELIAYGALMGEPEQLVAIDADDGRLLEVLDVDAANGSYDILVSSHGVVFCASHPNGNFYRYKPGSSTLENLGVPVHGVTFIWELIESRDGKIYGACYPESKVFEFDPSEGTFRDLGSAVNGEDYSRCLAYDSERNTLYIGVGSHAALIEMSLSTGEKRDILPAGYKSEHFVYSLGIAGNKLIARLDPSNKGIILNIDTGKVEAEIPNISSIVSQPSPDGSYVFFSSGQNLIQYDIKQLLAQETPMKTNGGARAFTWSVDPDSHSPFLYILYNHGKIARYDISNNRGTLYDAPLPRQPIHIQNIIEGPDHKIYSSGYVVGQVGVYDPETGSVKQFGGVRQAEGMTVMGSKIYFGTYPRAIISVFDTSQPQGKDNPKELFRLDEYGQDRPFGMLAVESESRVYIGTVPAYGLLGGVLAVYDTVSGELDVYKDVVPQQGIVSLAYKDGNLYGGTTISGGLGIEPQATGAKLFIWDVKKAEKIWELEPLPSQRIISGLRIAPDGCVWGWAEGALFIFDPGERKVIYSDDKFPEHKRAGHFWRCAFMTDYHDGGYYSVLFRTLFRLDARTKRNEVIATGTALEHIIRSENGNLYFVEKDHLFCLKPRKNE